jgi:RNA polymerase sigma-70 factor (ECF subfamily)
MSDEQLIAALRGGDEAAFATLVDRHSPAMLRVASVYVPSLAVAEEVVQETWLAALRGIDGFEGRSSLRSWLFGILTKQAMKSGTRERRSAPFSALAAADEEAPAVDPDRFLPPDHARWPNHWAVAPTSWPTPEDGLLSGELRDVVIDAIAALPQAQRTVIALRDIEGCSAEEVCAALEVSAGNQRVLLHRARSAVRTAIERYHGAVERLVEEDVVTNRGDAGTKGDPGAKQ